MAGYQISGFYKLSVDERLSELKRLGLLDDDAIVALRRAMPIERVDRIVENVIGVLTLPLGVALNFVVNGKDYVVPAAIEEPSVIAGMSGAAKLIAGAGGFIADSEPPLLIGQVQLVDVADPIRARAELLDHRDELLAIANQREPKMAARNGGAKDLEVMVHRSPGGSMVVLHLLVDTRDAMGANVVNSMCEAVAPEAERLGGGRVNLRILSNLTDRAIVRARTVIPPSLLEVSGLSGEAVRDAIVSASELAEIDPYRAATHNKGIMNGIDAVAIATGNDWRAIEAGVHAYAARGRRYTSLSRWRRNDAQDLVGEIEVPLKVGIVGGTIRTNPVVESMLRLSRVESARELGELMASVGLAQNFAALKALATRGIQHSHMSLHARSVASMAGATVDNFEHVVAELMRVGEVKVWKAKEIIQGLSRKEPEPAGTRAVAPGRLILVGEHAVLHGSRALAVPIPLVVEAVVRDHDGDVVTVVPSWGLEHRLSRGAGPIGSVLEAMLARVGLEGRGMHIRIDPGFPRAMGLGASAAIAVAVLRAVAKHFGIGLSESEISALAAESEAHVHGSASPLDHVVATRGEPILFRSGVPDIVEALRIPEPVRIVIGVTGRESLTMAVVEKVDRAIASNRRLCLRIFEEIDELAGASREALESGDLVRLGELMAWNHGLLHTLGLSCLDIEELIEIARENGALGAKLTGSGGGGSVVALCPDSADAVADAIRRRGYKALSIVLGPTRAPSDRAPPT
jgi:hydroxymethylglutaryl-CoA reductase